MYVTGYFFGCIFGFLCGLGTLFMLVSAIRLGGKENWIVTGILAVFTGACVIIAKGMKANARCPQCQKNWALDDVDRDPVFSTRISEKKQDGTYRYGNKVTYDVTYKCKHCGHTLVRKETKNEWD